MIPGLERSPEEGIGYPLQNACTSLVVQMGFSGGSDSKESACNAGGLDLIPGSGRSPEERNSDPFQFSHLENSMDRGAWWDTVYGDLVFIFFFYTTPIIIQFITSLPYGIKS